MNKEKKNFSSPEYAPGLLSDGFKSAKLALKNALNNNSEIWSLDKSAEFSSFYVKNLILRKLNITKTPEVLSHLIV